ncbi:peptidylprolyl isomerase [Marinobacterium rhizophilum]|uniref:peptidylprolyl isomerase n=1 Tax=Marinobacterium rhizophilum TaxID=420402 RepID=UPI000382DEAD|nr:peptidylprolyl isomerase [Marinobacterium rhizophilum]
MIRRLIKDPLLHFVLVGACLFGTYQLIGTPDTTLSDNTIVVDRDTLLTFIQYRSKAFQPDMAAQRLDDMTAVERQQLIHDFVREEALYRQAQALGMSENDYIIRRRSVQKLEFIAQSMAEQAVTADAEKVAAYFDAHRQDYYEEPSYTFTHVFIKGDTGTHKASDLLHQLNGQHVEFSHAARFGDRFLYHRNYVERTPDFIASHFGETFMDQLARIKPDTGRWQGPLTSTHGQHLVMLSEHQPGRVPELAQIQTRVEQDYLRWEQQQKQELAIQQIVGQYHVENRL